MGNLEEVQEIVEFSFESVADPSMPDSALLRLARQATAMNLQLGLTGHMAFEDGRFVQTLEGSAATLLPLAGRILADPRHQAIGITAFATIAARRYGNWSTTGFPAVGIVGEVPANLCVLPERLEPRRAATALGAGGRARLFAALPDA